MNKFELDLKYFQVKGTWEHAEGWYGLVQDIAIVYLLLSSTQVI